MFMIWVFTILTHALILIGMLGIFYFIVRMIQNEHNLLERIIRITSAMTGFLIYFGAKAVGFSIPELMMHAVATTHSFTFGVFAMILPAAAGMLVAWYSIRCIERDEDIAMRVVIMITTFILVMFVDVYGATYRVTLGEGEIMKSLVPNLIFTVAMSLYVIFQYKPQRSES